MPLLLLHAEYLLALKRYSRRLCLRVRALKVGSSSTPEAIELAQSVLQMPGGQLTKAYSIAAECCFVLRTPENFAKVPWSTLLMR